MAVASQKMTLRVRCGAMRCDAMRGNGDDWAERREGRRGKREKGGERDWTLCWGGREGGERTYSTAQVPWRGAGGFGKWCVGRLACVPIHVEAWGRGERERERAKEKNSATTLLAVCSVLRPLRRSTGRAGSPRLPRGSLGGTLPPRPSPFSRGRDGPPAKAPTSSASPSQTHTCMDTHPAR